MAGKIKTIIDDIIKQRTKGNPALIPLIKARLTLKGINPDKYTNLSPDEPVIIQKLEKLAKEI